VYPLCLTFFLPLETQVLGPHVVFQVLPSFYDSLRFVHPVLVHEQLEALYLDYKGIY
jgi:hypothetical protein